MLVYHDLFDCAPRSITKKFIENAEMVKILASYKVITEWVPILEKIQLCRDPKDDKFLELAINGHAKYIITGDKDLLVLNPFREIHIWEPLKIHFCG